MGDEALTTTTEEPKTETPTEVQPPPTETPKGITEAELNASEAVISLMLTGAWDQFEKQVNDATAKAPDEITKRELAVKLAEGKQEYLKQSAAYKEYMDTLKSVAKESGAPIEILSMAPDAKSIRVAGAKWKEAHVQAEPKAEPKPAEKTGATPANSAEKPAETPAKKLDSGTGGGAAEAADWRKMTPSEKIRFGMAQNRNK